MASLLSERNNIMLTKPIIFFNSGMDFRSTASLLSNLFHVSFVYDYPAHFEYLGLDFSLFVQAEKLPDKPGILFSRYQYQVKVVTYSNAPPYSSQMEEYLSLYIFHRLVETHQLPTMLIENEQHLYALSGDASKTPFFSSQETFPLVEGEEILSQPESDFNKTEYLSIFFNSGLSFPKTLHLLSDLFKISFVSDDVLPCYRHNDLDFNLLFHQNHGFQASSDSLWAPYQYEIRVLNRYISAAYALEVKKSIALHIFARLTKEQLFPALMVEDRVALDQRGSPSSLPIVESVSANKTFDGGQRQNEEMCLPVQKRVRNFPSNNQISGLGRQADRIINGVLTEYQILYPWIEAKKRADSDTIKNSIGASVRRGGQARKIIIDARDSGLNKVDAEQGLARAFEVAEDKLDQVEIFGDGFHVVRKV